MLINTFLKSIKTSTRTKNVAIARKNISKRIWKVINRFVRRSHRYVSTVSWKSDTTRPRITGRNVEAEQRYVIIAMKMFF